MQTIMEDPVILPNSNVSCDRSVIMRHLLSNETDPFNRTPLKKEDLIPNFDLKIKINNFIREKLKPNISGSDDGIDLD